MAKRRGAAQPIRLHFEHWRELTGIVCVGLAFVTLLSILPTERGALTEGWLRLLWDLFGVGMYAMPVALALIGAALVLDAVGRAPEFSSSKALSVVVLFVWLLTLLALVFPPPTDRFGLAIGPDLGPGGSLGLLLSEILLSTIGRVGAAVALLLALVIAGSLLADTSPLQLIVLIGQGFGRARDWCRLKFRPHPDQGVFTLPILPATPGQPPQHARPAGPLPSTGASSAVTTPAGTATVPRRLPVLPALFGAAAALPWELPNLENIFDLSTEREISQQEIRTRVRIIEETLASFGVPARVIEVNQGPAVTQFGVEPGFVEQKQASGRIKRSKVKVSKISSLANDLALALAAAPIRIEAPVPGRSIVGIEVPNMETSLVSLRSVMETDAFKRIGSSLRIALGMDVSGQPAAADLANMPHLLVAGATGSGKSVCINSVVACLLCNNTPEDLRFIMVDPKMVELTSYNGIPHLLAPVVIEIEKVVEVLHWTTQEMERRYKLFSKAGARNLEMYNANAAPRGENRLPKIVIIIDELADLMMAAPEQVERSICRIAQMARATGIHLVIATQRPSVDVITGLIKANFPARISFAVTSQIDSRVILDVAGAERLLGRGDMLFMSPDTSKLVRLQGCYVSDREIMALVRYWKGFRAAVEPLPPPEEMVQQPLWPDMRPAARRTEHPDDHLLDEAIAVVQQHAHASASLLQRKLRIGSTRAARLIDLLAERGIVSEDPGGGHSREVLVKAPAATPDIEASEEDDDAPPWDPGG